MQLMDLWIIWVQTMVSFRCLRITIQAPVEIIWALITGTPIHLCNPAPIVADLVFERRPKRHIPMGYSLWTWLTCLREAVVPGQLFGQLR